MVLLSQTSVACTCAVHTTALTSELPITMVQTNVEMWDLLSSVPYKIVCLQVIILFLIRKFIFKI